MSVVKLSDHQTDRDASAIMERLAKRTGPAAWEAWHRRTHVLLDQVASFATLGDLDQTIAAIGMLREHRAARPGPQIGGAA